MRAAFASALALVALLAPLALAAAPPPDAETASASDGVRIAYWTGEENDTRDVAYAPGEVGFLWFAVRVDAGATNATNGTNASAAAWTSATINVTSADLAFDSPTLTLAPVNGSEWAIGNLEFTVPENASAQASYAWTATVWRDENGTLVPLASPSGGAPVSVVAPAPPPTGLPREWLVGGAAVVLVAVGAGALAARSRAQRRKMRGQTRSQALREVELEERAEKRPEEAAVIRQELRQQEKVKEKRRDLQILEAKRADVLKTMELLRKRHEAGGLTKLQHDNMLAKKQADLQRIEAEIAAMEAEDAGGPGAAA